ncbi:ligand-binding protein SH3 [Achromobacter mucicolens]|uniref:DMT family transporter n=1 Tax=Achromobacter mucicolens TaxID=1389922 RepID=UPI000D390C8E|nr:ligand-binding protein SH3 [Achromobacter mucicolens]PTX03110.1 ligand-binding protein SH3 [Achromobacter mucicolens]
MAYLWLILSGACSVAASVALKATGIAVPQGTASSFLSQALPYLAAMSAYGLGFGFYALALRQLDLTLAYPLMVAFAIAGVFAYGLLSGTETVTTARMAGAAFIAIGIFLISK